MYTSPQHVIFNTLLLFLLSCSVGVSQSRHFDLYTFT